MARSLTAGMVTEVTAASLAPILLVKLEFDTASPPDELRLWTGIGDLTFNSQIYTGAGHLLSFSAIEESDELKAVGLTVTISGIPSEFISIALATDYMGRPATVWFGVLSGDPPALVADPVPIFAGLIDTMPIEDGGDAATIEIQIENHLVRLENARIRYYTDEDQQLEYPGDLGLEFVVALNDGRKLVWGRPG